MEIDLWDLRQDYYRVCHLVMMAPEVSVRQQLTKELTGVTLTLMPQRCTLPIGLGRMVNTNLAAVETLGVIGGVWPHDLVLAAAPHYTSVLVDPSRQHSQSVAYGPRLRWQLQDVVKLLRTDPTTRQAVLTIWEAPDLTMPGDRPCTLSLQFLLRDGQLECHVTMRSQDVWLGLAMDVFAFTQLQLTLAHELRVSPGKYVHHVGSLHAYARDWEKIKQLTRGDKFTLPDGWPTHGVIGGAGAARHLLTVDADGPDCLAATDNPWYAERVRRVRAMRPATVGELT